MFTTIFLQPLLNLLLALYNTIPGQELGFSIIALTILVKLVLWPFTALQIKQQRALQAIQPKIEEIRKTYKDNKDEQGRQLMALYAREKVNPASSCLPLVIQIPIFIGLYRALSKVLGTIDPNLVYSFVDNPGTVKTLFLGIVELTKPSWVLAIGAALVQFLQSRQMMKQTPAATMQPPAEVEGKEVSKDESMAAIMNKQMMYTMPILTGFIGFTLPAGLTLYWFVMSLLSVLQQWIIMRRLPPKMLPQLDKPTV